MKEKIPSNPIEVYPRTHLAPGIQPIISCIVDQDVFSGASLDKEVLKIGKEVRTNASGIIESGHDVSFASGHYDINKEKGFLNGGQQSYTISPIDSDNKFSYRFYNCTSIIVVGIDKKTGKNISFATHHTNTSFLSERGILKKFGTDLEKYLTEMKSRCQEGTVDAVILGGLFSQPSQEDSGEEDWVREGKELHRKYYLETIEFLSEKTEKVLGFSPDVVNGPKIIPPLGDIYEKDDIFFDSKERRVYFIRQSNDPHIGAFPGNKVNLESKKWSAKSTKEAEN